MTKLRISPGLSLPPEAVTRSFGILGMRGSGKSNAAVVLAEELHKVGLQWVAIDPKGDWWGLRSSGDGKGPGLPVVIFGGEHADVPLEPTAAAGVLVADLILNEGITCVLDLSGFSKGQKIQFLAGSGAQEGFAGRLFRKKKREHDPIHVFLEEAHDYVPQQARGELGKLIDVVSSLQTMGRTRGLGCSVLSQRSARVHKDVLTQVDTLVAFRTISPQDRDAIEAWVKDHGLARELVASLPELGDGESWVWSPEWLQTLERVRWRRRATYDSGSTPVIGKATRRPATLADVDLGAIELAMEATIERAEAEDPTKLRARLATLQRENKRLTFDIETMHHARLRGELEKPEVQEVRVEIPVLSEDDRLTLKGAVHELQRAAGAVAELDATIRAEGSRIASTLAAIDRSLDSAERLAVARTGERRASEAKRVEQRGRRGPAHQAIRRSGGSSFGEASETQLKAGARRILETFARHYPMRMTRGQLGTLARFKVSGGTFQTYFSQLKRLGFLEESEGQVGITAEGLQYIGHVPREPMTTEEIVATWRAALKAGARAMLDTLVELEGAWIDKEVLAERVGMTATGGTFQTYLSTLRRNGLADVQGGSVRANESLFLAMPRGMTPLAIDPQGA